MGDPLNLAHLRAVAEAATQGKWHHFSLNGVNAVEAGKKAPIVQWSGFDDSFRSPSAHKANAAHIATFDPPTVLALIARAEAAYRAGQEAMRARASAEAKNPNREGREWVNGSLWDAIAREQSQAIAALPLEEMP